MHHLARTHHVTAKGLANALMAQAHAKNWQLAGKVRDHRQRHAGFGRRAGAGGNHDALGIQRLDLGHGQFVIPDDVNVSAQLGQVLHDVVGEGVVVIDH